MADGSVLYPYNYGLGVEDGPMDEFEEAQELCNVFDHEIDPDDITPYDD